MARSFRRSSVNIRLLDPCFKTGWTHTDGCIFCCVMFMFMEILSSLKDSAQYVMLYTTVHLCTLQQKEKPSMDKSTHAEKSIFYQQYHPCAACWQGNGEGGGSFALPRYILHAHIGSSICDTSVHLDLVGKSHHVHLDRTDWMLV